MSLYLNAIIFSMWLNRNNLFAFFSFRHWLPPFLGKAQALKKTLRQSQVISDKAARRAVLILLRYIRLVNECVCGRIGVCDIGRLLEQLSHYWGKGHSK